MYQRILVPVDNSRHSNQAICVAASWAQRLGSTLTGFHVYGARLHETRFRQMEPGLPERYQAAQQLLHQRSVHETLISEGLRIISDSYLDHAERVCRRAGVPFERRLAEGRNYVEILREVGRDGCDLVAMGALGLGARRRSLIGSVSERVLRRSRIDVLLVRSAPPESRGVMVAIDGSPNSFKAVDAALQLGRALEQPVEVVSVFDPQFHIVAFRRMARVLSEEGAKLFRFQEQQKLHEEIIDQGLEKLYRSHLETAAQMAIAACLPAKTTLLRGKPFQRLLDYVEQKKPSLLVVGRFGLHRTEGADIGNTSENLARLARCSVLVVAGEPKQEQPWQDQMVPKRAQEDDVTRETFPTWTPEALARLQQVPEGVMRELTRQRVEKLARQRGHSRVTLELLETKYQQWSEGSARAASEMTWTEEAWERMERVPAFVRGMVVIAIEAYARSQGLTEITSKLVDEAKGFWGETGRFHHP